MTNEAMLTQIIDILKDQQKILTLINTSYGKQIQGLKDDIIKMIDKMDELRQTDINLKYLIGKNGKVL